MFSKNKITIAAISALLISGTAMAQVLSPLLVLLMPRLAVLPCLMQQHLLAQ
ncbi:hypothetical protein AI2899V1_2159 [Escherichia coli]|nr:hypothetical protein AI2899V1_2159 [Escherichia coli]